MDPAGGNPAGFFMPSPTCWRPLRYAGGRADAMSWKRRAGRLPPVTPRMGLSSSLPIQIAMIRASPPLPTSPMNQASR
jgi:hypothetical protein